MNAGPILAVLLAGCQAIPELEKTADVDEVAIRWVRGVAPNCGGVRSPEGCAEIGPSGCMITMPEDASDAIVAHEFRHCFGYRHKGE